MSPRPHPGSDDAALLAALVRPGSSAAAGTRRPSAAARGLFSGAGAAPRPSLLYWLPVYLTLALFAHVSLLGLRPALRESARLGAAEGRLLERRAREDRRALTLERILRAQRDPVYLERERRLLLDPAAGLPGR